MQIAESAHERHKSTRTTYRVDVTRQNRLVRFLLQRRHAYKDERLFFRKQLQSDDA
jgi:hypothetical protein